MYEIRPPAVYVHETVMANATYRARVERVVAGLKLPREVITYSDSRLPDMILKDGLLKNRQPMGTLPVVPDPVLLFNTFRFDGSDAEQSRAKALTDRCGELGYALNPLIGAGAFQWFDANLPTDGGRDDRVCRPCWRIHLQDGCVHKCKYCSFGGLLAVMVNVEEYCRHLGRIIERHPWQGAYLLDDDGDPPCLEPELGCLGYLIEYFGTLKHRYLIIHTKTWNTEWMRGLKHNGNTIIVWSISGPTQSREIEPVTGTTEQRVRAAAIAEEAGYQIRYKFKPIVPVRNWREEAAETIRLIFEKTHPDVISLCCFMWRAMDEMERHLPIDLLDPEYLKAAEASRAEVANTSTRPFPAWVRRELYDFHLQEIRKHNARIPVSLCTENWTMWAEFAKKLGMSAANYVCGCGPESTPRKRRLTRNPFKAAVRNDAGIPGVTGKPGLTPKAAESAARRE